LTEVIGALPSDASDLPALAEPDPLMRLNALFTYDRPRRGADLAELAGFLPGTWEAFVVSRLDCAGGVGLPSACCGLTGEMTRLDALVLKVVLYME
jgi:hypothetical protein